MRILIGADTFAPDINGSANFAKRLAVALHKRGHEVHVVAPAPDRHHGTRVEEHDGVELTVHRLYSWRWLPHPWLRFALPWRTKQNGRRIVDLVKPDVIHFQSHIVVGRGLAVAGKERGIRIIGTNHVMPENVAQHITIFPRFIIDKIIAAQWRAAARVFGMAEAITSPTRRSADYFEKMTGLRGVHAISNGIDANEYTPSFGPRTENRIVFVGRLDEEKHIDELIAATAKLDPALDVHVDIVGLGEDEHRLKRLAHQHGVEDRVVFHGKVSDEELKRTLTRGTVFAMPSRAELQCIAAMEAMASGLPVVAANAMALPHLVDHGDNGYLYEPGDIDEFARHLTAVLTAEPKELERMKRHSLEVVGRHSHEKTIDIFEALYRGESVVDPVTDSIQIPVPGSDDPDPEQGPR